MVAKVGCSTDSSTTDVTDGSVYEILSDVIAHPGEEAIATSFVFVVSSVPANGLADHAAAHDANSGGALQLLLVESHVFLPQTKNADAYRTATGDVGNTDLDRSTA
jgi:hypothetical protein